MSQSKRHDEERLDISAKVSNLRIGRWTDIRDLLMVRLRTTDEAGGLAKRCNTELAFDVGIQVGTGAVTPHPGLQAEWGVDQDLVWRTAKANTAKRLELQATRSTIGGFEVTILNGGLFTTGALADIEHQLARLGIDRCGDRLFATALTPTIVTVVEPIHARDCSADDDDLKPQRIAEHPRIEANIRGFCTDLRRAMGDPFPVNLFGFAARDDCPFDVQGSFTSGRILE